MAAQIHPTTTTTTATTAPGRTAWTTTKRTLGRGLALLGVGALATGVLHAWVGYQARVADRKLADEFVLELDLEQYRVVEKADVSLMALLSGGAAKQVGEQLLTRNIAMRLRLATVLHASASA